MNDLVESNKAKIGGGVVYKIEDEEVISVDLLSVEEAETIPRWVCSNGSWWWLQSSGYRSDRALFVGTEGIAYTVIGSSVDDNEGSVRPALEISNLPNLTIGETVEVFGLLAQYIGNDSALLCEPIGYHRFDEESNDYETSEIKSYLDGWFEERKKNENLGRIH